MRVTMVGKPGDFPGAQDIKEPTYEVNAADDRISFEFLPNFPIRQSFDALVVPSGKATLDVTVSGEVLDQSGVRFAAVEVEGAVKLSAGGRSSIALSFACFDDACSSAGTLDLSRRFPKVPEVFAFDSPEPLIPVATGALSGLGGEDLVVSDRDAGIVRILYAQNWSANGNPRVDYDVTITSAGERVGEVAAVGNFDAEEGLDLALSAVNGRSLDTNSTDRPGRVYLVPGALLRTRGATVDLATAAGVRVIAGVTLGARLGSALAAARLNGDNVDDLIIGAPREGVGGSVYVVLGGNMLVTGSVAALATRTYHGSASLQIGSSFAVGGEGNSLTLVLGAPEQSAVFVYRNKLAVPGDVNVGDTVDNDSARLTGVGGSLFGQTLALADVNADRSPELFVGAPWPVGVMGATPTVYGFDVDDAIGREETVAANDFEVSLVGDNGSLLGQSISAGRLDAADEGEDLLIGAPLTLGAGVNENAGAAYVSLSSQITAAMGSPPGSVDLARSASFTIYGPAVDAQLGWYTLLSDWNLDDNVSFAKDQIIVATKGASVFAIDGIQ